MKFRLRERGTGRLNWVNARSVVLNGREDLGKLDPALDRVLTRDLGIQHLHEKLCPVLFLNGKAGLFCVQAARFEDQTLATLDLLADRGYTLSDPAIYILPLSFLLSLNEQDSPLGRQSALARVDQPGQRSSMVAAFDEILQWACEHHASDIHVNIDRASPHSCVCFTIGGRYVQPQRFGSMSTNMLLDMLSVLWMDVIGGNGAVFDPNVEQQGRMHRLVQGKPVQIRWASLAADQGPSVCLRLLAMDQRVTTPSLAALGYLPSQVLTLQRCQSTTGGAIILAGAVGSGKSTTIATLMRQIPSQRKVITIEDPVEYMIPHALQNTVARDLSQDDLSAFDAKLKAVKRCAMNDLLIGEIRDQVGGRAFIDLAGTGVSLYTTVHASSALLIAERLSCELIGVPRALLSTPGVLKLLVHQRLLPTICLECGLTVNEMLCAKDWRCAIGESRDSHWKQRWVRQIEQSLKSDICAIRFRRASGCGACQTAGLEELNGISGRTVVSELIEPGIEPVFLRSLSSHQPLSLQQWFDARPRAALSDADMTGKSSLHCALFKMLDGQIDPRDIEIHFIDVSRWKEQTVDAA